MAFGNVMEAHQEMTRFPIFNNRKLILKLHMVEFTQILSSAVANGKSREMIAPHYLS